MNNWSLLTLLITAAYAILTSEPAANGQAPR
jgi:hypothetical protein